MAKGTDKTFGQHVKEYQSKNEYCDVQEARKEIIKDTQKKLNDTIQKGLKKYPNDFYIVIESKREIVFEGVIRNFIFHRISCPTPHYDQTAFKYHRKDDRLEFLWSIPRKSTVAHVYQYPLQEDQTLVKTVYDFVDGTFYRKALELNGELEGKQFDDQLIREVYG